MIIVWPIMGLNIPLPGWGHPEPAALRVMTFNIERWNVKEQDFAALLDTWRPDIVAVQECPSWQWRIPAEWEVERAGELIVVSRYPILKTEVSRCLWPPSQKKPFINGLRCTIATPYGPVGFACVHLDTPKPALQLILDPEKVLDFSQIAVAEDRLEYRRLETVDMVRWLAELPEPKIIAGDFNMPVESGLYQDYWARYRNAFSQAGFGFGHTKHTTVDRLTFGSRIDHVVTSPGFNAVRCRVGPDLGSDHLPLIADIGLAHE